MHINEIWVIKKHMGFGNVLTMHELIWRLFPTDLLFSIIFSFSEWLEASSRKEYESFELIFYGLYIILLNIESRKIQNELEVKIIVY